MIGVICLSYIVLNFPATFVKMVDPGSNYVWLSYASKFLYFSKYSANFLIYCASNAQYREAYLLFLKEVLLGRCGTSRQGPGEGDTPNVQVAYMAGRIVPYSG